MHYISVILPFIMIQAQAGGTRSRSRGSTNVMATTAPAMR